MDVSLNHTYPHSKSKQTNQFQNIRKIPIISDHMMPSSYCESRLVVLDVIMLVVVIGAIFFALSIC